MFSELMKEIVQKYTNVDLQIEKGGEALEFHILEKKNLALVIANFYLFNSISTDFVINFARALLTKSTIHDLDIFLLLIKSVGLKIRSDSPPLLKRLIDDAKQKIEQIQSASENRNSVIEFILLTLNDIKMNKKVEGDLMQSSQFLTTWLQKNVVAKMSLSKKLFPLSFD